MLSGRTAPETLVIACSTAVLDGTPKRGRERFREALPAHRELCEEFAQTASLTALTGRALMSFRAGLALNTVGSLVKGLMPLRALVAGFLTTTNFAKPGSTKAPVFLSSL